MGDGGRRKGRGRRGQGLMDISTDKAMQLVKDGKRSAFGGQRRVLEEAALRGEERVPGGVGGWGGGLAECAVVFEDMEGLTYYIKGVRRSSARGKGG